MEQLEGLKKYWISFRVFGYKLARYRIFLIERMTKMEKRLLLVFAALTLVFAMVACTPKEPVEAPPVEVPSVEEEMPDVQESEVVVPEEPVIEDKGMVSYEEIVLTPVEAFDIYAELYPDKLVSKIELDKYFGSYIYKVTGYKEDTEVEIKIDPVNGDVIDTETELEIDLDRERITIDEVEKIQEFLDKAVLDAGANAMVDEWTLEWDDGNLQLEIDVDLSASMDIDYTYNIITGELIEKDL
jgi:uncharacterized membrane protein YkoI